MPNPPTDDRAAARALMAFIDASPSPFHACRNAALLLEQQNFRRYREEDAWALGTGGGYVLRGGSLVAWWLPERAAPAVGFRMIGAHTDSPNLRVKPRPDTGSAGWRQLGVEVYGGVLLNSWLDRDLGLSGRAFVRGERGPEPRLFCVDRPVLRVPQLAIHLHREVTSEGLKLNPEEHLRPVWGLGAPSEHGFRGWLANELGVASDDVLSWDAMCHDLSPSRLLGDREELVSAPRLDNLGSCSAALRALVAAASADAPPARPLAIALFDHEEVGSTSARGASGPLLRSLFERLVLLRGGSREDYHRALADSLCVSADMAHAVHPNYREKHERDHWPLPNKGPVIKVNASQRYASEGETEALFQDVCERSDVPYQKWVNRADLACGSTIGPLTAANLGVRTVDVGCPQLAMHSARELAGALDPGLMVRALVGFLTLS